MASDADRAWQQAYDVLRGQADTLANDVSARAKLVQQGSEDVAATQQLRRRMQLLERDTKALQSSIGASNLSDKEKTRRRNLCAHILGQLAQHEAALQRRPAFATASAGGASGARKWGEEDPATQGVDNTDLLTLQQRIMTEQDKGLDALSATIARQKEIGKAINRELQEQDPLLDKLGAHVDSSEQKINRETKRVIKLSSKSAQGGALCCMVLVIIIFIVFAASDWGKKFGM